MQTEIIPAILAKSKEDLLKKILLVKDHVKTIQLDIMDGEFVPNKTVGLDDLIDLPKAKYEFHWMVKNPKKWIEKIDGPHIHLLHVETINENDFSEITNLIKKKNGIIGLAINPPTDLNLLSPFIDKVERVLVMTVNPGFSGQKYISEMETKIKTLRKKYPKLNIEVDGGINLDTIKHAYSAGANLLAAASAIFAESNIKTAIEKLQNTANGV